MPSKRPLFRYSVLALLLAITVAYEVRYLSDIVRGEKIDVPVFAADDGTNRIGVVDLEAAKAGIRRGDILIAVNGVAYTGAAVLGNARENALPGTFIVVTVRSPDPGQPRERIISLPVMRSSPGFWEVTADVVLHFLLPALCLLLGFWVVLMRPHDGMAWLLFSLMMSFPHILETYKIEGWGPGWREAGMLYHATLDAVFPIAIFLFGRYFPEPFPKTSIYEPAWKVQFWLLAVPFSVFGIESVIVRMRDLDSYRSVYRLNSYFRPFDRLADLLVYLLIGSFFAAIGIKWNLTKSPDARRRLRLLYWGATIAFTPALALTLYGRIKGVSLAALFPQWAIVLALLPLALFPLTLAYVIVVQKAMGVGVALRQGLQYALARSGIRLLQALAVIAVIATAATLATHESRNRPQKITVIAVGIIAVLTIRRAGERLRGWIDRRFFRETYDAEQVLTELSDQVRAIVEPKSLLETVASRVADTLHISRVAVLLGSDAFRPAYAMGYGDLSAVTFPPTAGVVKLLRQQNEPARVYLENPDSWLYLEPDVEDDERSKLAALGSELLLPLAVRDKLLGFISLGPKKSEEPYTGSDLRLLKSVAAQTGLALENANLMREIANEIAQRERLNREVEIAREVQERLFPQKLPAIAGLDYAGQCRTALGVGGDYYDFLALPQGQLGVAVGDVSGKGIAAALMMASLQASLRGEATRAPENLAAAVGNVNRLVYEASSQERYATFFYGQYDPASRRFDYVNAGHNPPMLFRCSDGQWTVTRLDVGGTVVGLLETFPYQQGSVSLATGDVLVAFTDGISEAMNSSDEEWGEQRLIATVEHCAGVSAERVLVEIFAAADTFVAGTKQHDDMTLVILKVVNQSG